MDKGDIPFSIFLDLSKAFDMINHDIALFNQSIMKLLAHIWLVIKVTSSKRS